MKRIIIAIAVLALAACSGKPAFDPAAVSDATAEQVTRVEPLSWWVGMKTDLQLLVQGDGIFVTVCAIEECVWCIKTTSFCSTDSAAL